MKTIHRRRVRVIQLLGILAVCGMAAASLPAQDFGPRQVLRRWTDTQTNQAVRARLVNLRNGIVTLRGRNDETWMIDQEHLSRRDWRFIEKQLSRLENEVAGQTRDPELDALSPAVQSPPDDSAAEFVWQSIRWYPVEQVVNESNANQDMLDRPVFWLRVLGDLNGFM